VSITVIMSTRAMMMARMVERIATPKVQTMMMGDQTTRV
jgi:hypothetical protein